MRKINCNLKFVEHVLLYFCEIPFKITDIDVLINKALYIQSLKTFEELFLIDDEDYRTYYLTGVREGLTVLLNFPNVIDLNNWFEDHATYYLQDNCAVVDVLKLIWETYFEGETVPNLIENEVELVLLDSEIDF